jgi:hypothetical protein
LDLVPTRRGGERAAGAGDDLLHSTHPRQ